jgi:hypothetical protein
LIPLSAPNRIIGSLSPPAVKPAYFVPLLCTEESIAPKQTLHKNAQCFRFASLKSARTALNMPESAVPAFLA